MFKITDLICVLNYTGKRGEIGYIRDSGKFEITVFEIVGVQCASDRMAKAFCKSIPKTTSYHLRINNPFVILRMKTTNYYIRSQSFQGP